MRKAVEPDGTQQEMTSALEGWDKATGAERDWLEANRESVEITLRATQHAACVFHDPREMTLQTVLNDVQATRDLGRLLVLDARRLESEGELDAALEHYLATLRMAQHVAARGSQMQLFVGIALEALVDDMMPRWAAHREQTPERIRHAIRKIQGLAEHAPGRSDAAVVEYLILRRLLLGDWSLLASVSDDQIAQIILWIMDRWMPWERQRSLRLLDVLIAEDLARSDSFQKALAAGQAVPYSRLSSWGIGPQGENGKWLQTTVVLRLHYPALAYSAEAITRSVTRQRALLLILALKGWQIEHGELPSSLDDLVGSYFSGLPTDPYSGGQFGYLPRGFEGPVEAGSRNQIGLPSEAIIEPGQPVIWSTLGLYGGLTRSGRGDDKGRPLLFLNGWPFVIP
ncbi:MAG: hypothetical protein HY000_03650 [Planctomycetes bacterium]|nr:hypothetical protein [Planctomycetota bacterium]